MRILNAHNRHAGPGGMEVLFESITRLLRDRGHDVLAIEKDNANISGITGKLAAFTSMIHSRSSRAEFDRVLAGFRPDVVHLHNLFPQLSPGVIDACRAARVPVVMSVQDYKLTCPTAQHLRNNRACEKCLGGREYWCAIHNCRGSRAMSVAYAIRNASARVRRVMHRGVDRFLCCTRFVADLIVRGGYPAERVHVLPNFADLPDAPPRTSPGDYVAYVGRISPEKGIDVLIEAARLTGLPVRIAGDRSALPGLLRDLPDHVSFVGKLSREQLPAFLQNARSLVVPSVWYEAFGIVCAEAMAYRLPVIASRIGGLPEVVEHDRTGLTVAPRDPHALADAMRSLWNDPAHAAALGEAGREKALREYSPHTYYHRLTTHYRAVVAQHQQSHQTHQQSQQQTHQHTHQQTHQTHQQSDQQHDASSEIDRDARPVDAHRAADEPARTTPLARNNP
jgi:glycosyltransferase involved in cell wall biosynthesis